MLKYSLAAIAAATLIAIAIVVFGPRYSGPRPEPRILATNDPPTGFVVHDAPPPAADPAPGAPPAGDLAAVMARLRAGTPKPDADATPAAAPSPATPATPTPAVPAVAPPVPDPPSRGVTSLGTRWRMARSPAGFTLSIDLGGGQTADVKVLSAFSSLDPAGVAVRVDYLRDTILQHFDSQSHGYVFNRDGSVSQDR